MLLFARGAELSVGEVAERAGIGQSTASQQLTHLRRGGIVTPRREGKVVLYSSNRQGTLTALADLQDHLRVCCSYEALADRWGRPPGRSGEPSG